MCYKFHLQYICRLIHYFEPLLNENYYSTFYSGQWIIDKRLKIWLKNISLLQSTSQKILNEILVFESSLQSTNKDEISIKKKRAQFRWKEFTFTDNQDRIYK